MKGISKPAAITNLNKVRDKGLIIPDSFADDKNEPATSRVTNSTKKWCLKIFIVRLPHSIIYPTDITLKIFY